MSAQKWVAVLTRPKDHYGCFPLAAPSGLSTICSGTFAPTASHSVFGAFAGAQGKLWTWTARVRCSTSIQFQYWPEMFAKGRERKRGRERSSRPASFLPPPILLLFPTSLGPENFNFSAWTSDSSLFPLNNSSFYVSPSLPYFLYFRQDMNPNTTSSKVWMNCNLFHVGGNKEDYIRLFSWNAQSSPIFFEQNSITKIIECIPCARDHANHLTYIYLFTLYNNLLK